MDIGPEMRVIEVAEHVETPVLVPVAEEPVSFDERRPAPMAD